MRLKSALDVSSRSILGSLRRAWKMQSVIAPQVFALSRSAAGGVGCSIETGADAGKVSLRASSSASSWCLRSGLRRERLS
jgi:hypothetical protein